MNLRRLLPAVLFLCPAAAFAAKTRYDVAYLWHADKAKAFDRRDEVAQVLGPKVEEKLEVVRADGGYAVVYLRHGDLKSARSAVAAHSELLEGRVFTLPSRDWVEVEEDEDAGGKTASSQLEALVDEHVKRLRRQGRIAPDERTAWSVYDFATGETLVEINADVKLQAASLIKPFLALAYMDRVREGKLPYDNQARVHMRRMIQNSDNASANWVMRRLGGPSAVQRLLQKKYGEALGGVQITEYIPSGGRTYRNKATARDYSRFLLALWRNELPGSQEIKRLMALPKRDRLHTGVDLPDDTGVYTKTGSTSRLCGDIGVLTLRGPGGKRYPYALVGIIEKGRAARNYFRWLRSRGNVIREISGLVSHRIGALHGLSSLN